MRTRHNKLSSADHSEVCAPRSSTGGLEEEGLCLVLVAVRLPVPALREITQGRPFCVHLETDFFPNCGPETFRSRALQTPVEYEFIC